MSEIRTVDQLPPGDATPSQVKALLDLGHDLVLLDVREPAEVAICRIEGALEIPLGVLPLRFSEVPMDRDVVVFCKMGGRSAQAVWFLNSKGYTRVRNLSGGIIRWADEVDPGMRKY